MGMREDLLELQPPAGPKCGVAKFLAVLDGPERAEMTKMFADPLIRHKTFSVWASKKKDMHLPSDTVSRHRKGECSCGHR